MIFFLCVMQLCSGYTLYNIHENKHRGNKNNEALKSYDMTSSNTMQIECIFFENLVALNGVK